MSLSFHLCLFLCFLLRLSFYRLPPLSFFVCCSLPPFRSASLFLSFILSLSLSIYLSLTFFFSSETYEIRPYFSRATLVQVSKSMPLNVSKIIVKESGCLISLMLTYCPKDFVKTIRHQDNNTTRQ